MFIRTSTRAWLFALATLVVTGSIASLLYYLPARTSSAVRKVNVALPETTEVMISGTAVAQFPPPPGAADARPPVGTPTEPSSTTTTIVTLTDTLQERAPYTPPGSITLQQELEIPVAELAALRPELSEHRTYGHGEEPKIGVTDETRAIAMRYLAAFNAVRAKQGLPALHWDTDLARRAEGHAATRLWYFILDGGRQVSGPREHQIDAYYGTGYNPRYATIGLSSHGMPTTLLVDASDEAAIIKSLTDSDGNSLYGAGSLPATRLGVGIAVAQNGEAAIPHGWLTILFQ